jgi:glutathione S-transferase
MITIHAARWVPPFAQGLVRDIRLRWALEEAGLPYEEKLLSREEYKSEEYRELQPFNQIPVYEEDGFVLFESGAIVLHIAMKSGTLLPKEPQAHARAVAWMFAALNSVEPHIQNLAMIDLFSADEEWAKQRRPVQVEMVEARLDALVKALGDRDYLEGDFSAADIMMITVLRIVRNTDLIAKRPVLDAYQKRCEARPAFRKALEDQLAAFKANEPVPA